METTEDPQGGSPPASEAVPSESAGSPNLPATISHDQVTDTAYYSSDYTYGSSQAGTAAPPYLPAPVLAGSAAGGGGRSLPPPPASDEGDEEEDGMLRMSFLEHLEELRRRIFYLLGGFGVAFLVSFSFCSQLWQFVSAPAVDALKQLKINPPNLTQLTPMESFNVIWVKVPVLCSIFLSSPWVLYQVWAFVSPGLYKRERKWAVPFVISTAGLFITGGLFAYFVAFRYGLVFLLGIGRNVNVTPMVSINEYFDLFVNVTLGIGVVFELPILIFFLTLLRLVTPQFLVRNSRYAILIIVIIAAVVTPTPDIFNLLLFATPMILLFYLGVLASYLLILNREGKRFPWIKVALWAAAFLAVSGGIAYYVVLRYGYHFIFRWPFLKR